MAKHGTGSTSLGQTSSAGEVPRPLAQLSTLSEVHVYLKSWTSQEYWDMPGFMIGKEPPRTSFNILLIRESPVLNDFRVPESSQRKLKAYECLVMLFQSMVSNSNIYHRSKEAFRELVSSDVGLTVKQCRSLQKWYVSARLLFLRLSQPSRPPRSTLTELVDEWIELLDRNTSQQQTPLQQGSFRASAISTQAGLGSCPAIKIPGEPEALAGPSHANSTPGQRKGKVPSPEPSSSEKVYISIEENEHRLQDFAAKDLDMGRNKKRKWASATVKEDTPETPEEPKKSHKKRKVSSLSPMTVSSPGTPITPASKRNSTIDSKKPPASDAAIEKLSNLVDKRHIRYTARYEKLKSRSSDHKQRIDNLEDQVSKIGGTLESTVTTLGLMSDDLEELNQLVRQAQSSTASMEERFQEKGDIFQNLLQHLKDALKVLVKDRVRVTWQGAALELSSKTRDIDAMLKDLDTRLDNLSQRVDQQDSDRFQHVLRSGNRYEQELRPKVEDLDRRLGAIEQQGKRVLALEQTLERCEAYARDMARKSDEKLGQREKRAQEMEMLRNTVAVQASTMAQMEKQMVEMAEQISELSKKQSQTPLKGLWTPQR